MGPRFPIYSRHLKSAYNISRDYSQCEVGINAFFQDTEPRSVFSFSEDDRIAWKAIYQTCLNLRFAQIHDGAALSLSTWLSYKFYRSKSVCRSLIPGLHPLHNFNNLLGNLILTFQNKDCIWEAQHHTKELNRLGSQFHSWWSQILPCFLL